MKGNTILIVAIVVLVVGALIYMANQQSENSRALQQQLAVMDRVQPESNVWSSLGDAAGIINALGDVFGKKDANNTYNDGEAYRTDNFNEDEWAEPEYRVLEPVESLAVKQQEIDEFNNPYLRVSLDNQDEGMIFNAI